MATSKTPKQPPFPHPPLEVGVAQYPTPLVPNYNDKTGGWNILDQGHIILVEKINIEKGSFTPLPLDGSVTYTGRDANKWPSTLYLVAEKPTPDGEFCFRYWANDRSLSSQELWNYGLDYSANNPSYPITSRTYIVPRSQYSTITLGTHDPVFGGTQIISQQKMVELPEDNPLASRYVAVQRVYETIPGPVITGKRLDQRGDLETVNVQTVVAGTSPDSDGLLVTETKVDGVDSVKSTKTTASVASYATLTTKTNKAGLLGDTSTTDNIVAPTTNPDDLSTTILESTVEQLTATKARKRTTTSTGPTSLTGDEKKAGLLGITETVESIVAAGASPDSLSTTVLQSQVTPIDSAKSKKTTITSSGPTELDGVAKKAGLLGETSVVESIVAYGSSADNLSTSVISSEVTPIDAYKSKKTTIASSGPNSLGGYSLQEFGIATTTESIVSNSETISDADEKTIKEEIEPIDSGKSKKIKIAYATIPAINGYQYDDQFEKNLRISKQIVAAGAGPLSSYNGLLSYKDEPINPYQSQRIIVDSNGQLPPSRTEYHTGTYTSPLLVFDITTEYANVACFGGSDWRVKLTPVTRSSQSRQTVFKTITTYNFASSLPSPGDTSLFGPELKEISYTGYSINFNLGAALCEHIHQVVTVQQCGISAPIQETIDIPATSLTPTTYTSYIGTYKKISWERKYWKAGIYQDREVQVKII